MTCKIAIIGAGLAGISAALELEKIADVTVFEKSRGYGGRMSTRTRSVYQFDHGAQYFTAKNKIFKSLMNTLLDRDIVKLWDPKIVKIDPNNSVSPLNVRETFYVPIPKMSSLCRYLAAGLSVKLNTKINRVEKQEKWVLYQDSMQLGEFDWVVFAMPPQQVIEMAPSVFGYLDEISDIKMQACYALMVGLNNPLNVNWDTALVNREDINWVAINSLKPNRPSHTAIVAQSTASWATNHLESDQSMVKRALVESLSAIMDLDLFSAEHIDLHRWRYAKVESYSRSQPGFVDFQNQLAACGDWCIDGKIEAAFDSGVQTAYKLIEKL